MPDSRARPPRHRRHRRQGPRPFDVTNVATQTFGSFSLLKALDGTGSALVADLTYPVEVQIGSADPVTVDLAVGTPWDEAGQLAIGTVVKVREGALPSSPGIQWGDPQWTADGASLTTDADGWATFTITSDQAPAAVTVTNAPTQLFGGFSVEKTVDIVGDPTIVPDATEYTVQYRIGAQDPVTLTLTAGQTSDLVAGLPFGTVVQVREQAPPAIDGVVWSNEWTVDGSPAAPDADGWVSFTIDSATPVQFVVTNIGTQQLGAFQISKSVAGDGAELVAQDTVFSFSYTLGDGDPRIVTATPAEASAVVNGLPYGTVVTIDEIAFSPVAGIEWGTPAWSLDGQAVDGPVRFTVGSVDTVDIVATNTATRVFGSFEVTKSVTGAGADLVGDDVPFVVEYSLDGGATWTALDAVTKAAPTVAAPKDIPVGTTVLVREVAPAAIPGVEWGAPAFSGDGVNPASAGEPASFTITESGALVEVTLTNPTTPHNGQFTVTKQITGAGAQLAPAGLEFTLRYSYEGQASPGVMTLKAGTLSPSEAIPTGTTVTVTEVKLADSVLTGGGSWGEPVFVLPDGSTLKNGSTIVIGDGKTLALVLQNPVLPPLPATGGSLPWTLTGLAVMLLLVGGLLAAVGIRRRRDAQV